MRRSSGTAIMILGAASWAACSGSAGQVDGGTSGGSSGSTGSAPSSTSSGGSTGGRGSSGATKSGSSTTSGSSSSSGSGSTSLGSTSSGGSSASSSTTGSSSSSGSSGGPSNGNDIYITADGNPAGACTTNVQTPTFFNTASNWGSGPGLIGPGTTVHLCGTFSSAQPGQTLLTAQGGGSAGAPLTILFDTGAVLTSPAWAPAGNPGGGALDFSNSSYAIINGGANGLIENSANGTNLTYHQTTLAIAIDGACTNCEVTNLTIANLYVHSPGSCDDSATVYGEQADHTLMNAIRMGNASGSTVDHVTIHDVGWAILSNASDTTIGPGVEISNIDHGFTFGPAQSGDTIGGVVFYGNWVHDYAIWDDSQDCNHHDGIHGFGPLNGTNAVVTDFWAFDNVFDGDTGTDLNQHIFLEATNDGTPWTTSPASMAYIFDNYFSTSEPHDPPVVSMSGIGSGFFVNNTVIGNTVTPQDPTNDQPCTGFGSDGTAPELVENNVVEGCGTLIGGNEVDVGGNPAQSNVPFQAFDYNGYANCSGYNCFFVNLTGTAVDTASFSTWQSQSGFDAHSVADPGSIGYGVTVGSDFLQLTDGGAPLPGSPLVGTGANLSSLCDGGLPLLANLCQDLAGNPRPGGDAGWDIGAYQH